MVSYISQIEMNDTFYIHSSDYREDSRKRREKRKEKKIHKFWISELSLLQSAAAGWMQFSVQSQIVIKFSVV